jgi:hypothetical protein
VSSLLRLLVMGFTNWADASIACLEVILFTFIAYLLCVQVGGFLRETLGGGRSLAPMQCEMS